MKNIAYAEQMVLFHNSVLSLNNNDSSTKIQQGPWFDKKL